MAAYGLGRAPYPGVGGYSGECVLFVRLGGTRSLFTRLRLKMWEEKNTQLTGGNKFARPPTKKKENHSSGGSDSEAKRKLG